MTDAIDRALCCGPTCGRGTDATGPCVAASYGAGIRQRAEAAGYIVLSATDHDRRITELLEANNREVERRRAMNERCAVIAEQAGAIIDGWAAGKIATAIRANADV